MGAARACAPARARRGVYRLLSGVWPESRLPPLAPLPRAPLPPDGGTGAPLVGPARANKAASARLAPPGRGALGW